MHHICSLLLVLNGSLLHNLQHDLIFQRVVFDKLLLTDHPWTQPALVDGTDVDRLAHVFLRVERKDWILTLRVRWMLDNPEPSILVGLGMLAR